MTWHDHLRDWARASVVASAAGASRLRWPRRRRRVGAPRILLVRPDHLGDVLLTTPAIAALRAALPDALLIALVGPWAAEALANNPHLDEIHITPFPGMARKPARKPSAAALHARSANAITPAAHVQGLWQSWCALAPWAPYTHLIRAARRLARWRLDAAINFRPDFWWGASLLALAGIPIRVGYDRTPGNRALTHRVAWPASPEHATQSALRLAATTALALGAPTVAAPPWPPDAHPLVFALPDDARAWAAAWFDRAGLPGGARPLLIHPGAGAAVKLWTAESWARVCERLAEQTGAPVVVAGTRAEADLVTAVTQATRSTSPVVLFTEDVPLARYAALLAAARLALGVDSGPLHLATALGTPTVRLFGPTDPAIYGPWGPSGCHVVVRGGALPCMPCGRLDYRPGDLPAHPCVRLIRPDAVIEAALDVLRRVERRRATCDDRTPDGSAIPIVGSSTT